MRQGTQEMPYECANVLTHLKMWYTLVRVLYEAYHEGLILREQLFICMATEELCSENLLCCLWGEAGWQNREPGHEFTHTHSWVFFLLQFIYSMGLDHDDDSADSADGADCPNYKYIMSSEKNTAPTSYMWSPCSRTRIQTFLNSG